MRHRSILVLALALVLTACGDDDTGSPTTTNSTAASTTTTVAVDTTSTTGASSEAATWARVVPDATIFGGAGDETIAGITAGGPGLVAVGSDYEGSNGSDGSEPSDGDAAVWISADGLAWTRVAHDESVFGGESWQEMQAVIALGTTLVAVGVDNSGGDPDAAVWISSDGLTWNRVVAAESVLGGPGGQAMLRVAAGGPGLVAVGFDDPLNDFDWDAAVWTSPDGLSWTRVEHDEAIFGGESIQSMWGVADIDGVVVAVGTDASHGTVDAAVWTSPDGVSWTRIPHDDSVFGGIRAQRISAVAVGGSGLVAVGSDAAGEDRDAAVWTSPDGSTWVRVVNPALGGTGDQAMSGVAAGDAGLVAVGSDASIGDGDAAVWTSVDGLTWTRVGGFDGAFGGANAQAMGKVIFAGPGVVAVGSDSFGGNSDAAVWTATIG